MALLASACRGVEDALPPHQFGDRPKRVTLALLAAPGVAVILFAAVWLAYGVVTADPPPPADAPAEKPTGFACTQVSRPGEEPDDYCSRMVADLNRRSSPDDAQRRSAEPAQTAIGEVIAGPRKEICGDPSVPCLSATVGAIEPASADDVRQRLIAAGYPRAIVRNARPDDPAPRGTLIFAVRAGWSVCSATSDTDPICTAA